jgi:quercetin dioxygenase-like cupin family protein
VRAGHDPYGMHSGSRDDLVADAPYPGIERRTLDGRGATVVWYEFAPAARFPQHRHPQEQITVVEAGTVSLSGADDDAVTLGAGDWSTLAGGVEHGITAGPDGARIVIVLVPRRAAGEQPEVLST